MEFLNQIIGAFVGLIVGTLLGNEISRFLYRPKVIIRFKDINPLYTKDGFFGSIHVANLGRTVATDCMGTISLDNVFKEDIMESHEAVSDESLPSYRDEKIDLDFPRSQLVSPLSFREIKNVSLCWSMLGNPFKIDINPGTTQSLDIFRMQFHNDKKFWYIIFPSEKGWRNVRVRMKLKHITGRILICPSNEFPTILKFAIKISANKEPVFIPIKSNNFKRLFRFIHRENLYFK